MALKGLICAEVPLRK